MPTKHVEHLIDQFPFSGNDAIRQVGPVEFADQDRGIAQIELRDDVSADAFRGRGRIAVNCRAGKQLLQSIQLPIFLAEIVSPMADAMRFIDRERAYANLLQQSLKSRQCQPLRRHEQQSYGAPLKVGLRQLTIRRRLTAVNLDGRHAGRASPST